MATSTANTALITGASSGIGLELARVLAANGYRLVLVARDAQRLASIADELEREHNTRIAVLPEDLSKPEAAQALFAKLSEGSIEVDVLVNNAGFGSNGPFHEIDAATEIEMIQVNVTALVQLTQLLLPGMVARGSGRILNVGSLAGFQPDPFMATYGATKAFVQSFSEAISNELEGTGVTVTALCPGPVRTHFGQRAGIMPSSLSRNSIVLDAAPVAKAGFDGMMKGKRVVAPGLIGKLHWIAVRLLPRALMLRIVASINKDRRM